MKKLSALMFAMLLLVSCAHVTKGGFVRSEIVNIYNSSVSITDAEGDVSGSGTIIRNSKGDYIAVITAAHVINGIKNRLTEQKKEVAFYIKTSYSNDLKKVVVTRIDEKKDLPLVLGVDKEVVGGPSVKVSQNNPNIGDPVWVIGAPAGDERTVTTGIVSNFDGSFPGKKMFRITAPIFFGNSGGGVFNSDMELIGVVNSIQIVGGIIVVPGAGFAVALQEVRAFL